jgi:hypothetical protein
MLKGNPLIYLASPYSNSNPAVVQRRFELACLVTAKLFEQGFHVFSPICHSDPIARMGQMKGDFNAWRTFDLRMLKLCDVLAVLTLAGWQSSVGMKEEYKAAMSITIPIYECDLYGVIKPITDETRISLSEDLEEYI